MNEINTLLTKLNLRERYIVIVSIITAAKNWSEADTQKYGTESRDEILRFGNMMKGMEKK